MERCSLSEFWHCDTNYGMTKSISGNFADELGEDFLGLRDLGIAKEEGLASLTVPSSLFYGRRKRMATAGLE
jgi:hypothetical protein